MYAAGVPQPVQPECDACPVSTTYQYVDRKPPGVQQQRGFPLICLVLPVLAGLLLLPFLLMSGLFPNFPGFGTGPQSCPRGSPPPTLGPNDPHQINGKPFPVHWDHVPVQQKSDYVPLPLDYGMGSSSVAEWINQKVEEDAQRQIYYSPNGKLLPHWNNPPPYISPGEDALVVLPFDLGSSDSKYKAWVMEHINEDRHRGGWFYSPNFVQYPKQWGEPPAPYPPMNYGDHMGDDHMGNNVNWLPFHTGKGPCKLARWIMDGYNKFPRKPEAGKFQNVNGQIYQRPM